MLLFMQILMGVVALGALLESFNHGDIVYWTPPLIHILGTDFFENPSINSLLEYLIEHLQPFLLVEPLLQTPHAGQGLPLVVDQHLGVLDEGVRGCSLFQLL
jgi:hypothetical protein